MSIAELYDVGRRFICPKCGHVNQPLQVRYQVGPHRFEHIGVHGHKYACSIVNEHLHGWCDHCEFTGPSFAFATRKPSSK